MQPNVCVLSLKNIRQKILKWKIYDIQGMLPRKGHASTVVGDTLVIHSGRRKREILTDLYLFDLDTKFFIEVDQGHNSPGGIFFHCLFKIQNSLYIFGGLGITSPEQTKAVCLNLLMGFHLEDTFEVIPMEIIFDVISYLEPIDLCNFGATCSYMYHTCGSDKIWKRFQSTVLNNDPVQYRYRARYCEIKNDVLFKKRKIDQKKIETENLLAQYRKNKKDNNFFEYNPRLLSMYVIALPETIKMMVHGDGGVGKTSILVQYTQGHFHSDYIPFHDDEFRKQIRIQDRTFYYDIFESQNDEFPVMTDQYLRQADVHILLYSSTSLSGTYEVKRLVDRIAFIRDYDEYNTQKECAIVIVGNKSDLEDDREVVTQDMEEYCRGYAIQFIETSARNNIGIIELFETIIPTELGRILMSREHLATCGKKSCVTM